VPKNRILDPSARAAAIWTAGHLLAGETDSALVTALCARIADIGPPEPEWNEVRIACVITLGRMKAEEGLPTLRSFRGAGPIYGEIEYACAWAIHQIGGGPAPEFAELPLMRRSWFLEPAE
jgi:hypothetical protein